ncbi:hypothetical protein Pint_03358 [Pistacia integerrima]|uniref:Uncharacterized protein n=1 Tax=Pistacia integerrima TaxID=434235 RepID=A0ACC0ZNX6_9ROSI|nr:hypothetical protein Pint_03358 [Pistacia integerrima]
MAKKLVQYSVVMTLSLPFLINSPFKGNPAAVCLLDEDRDEDWLQSVALEFNISETCYLTRLTHSESDSPPRFRLRWFTPVAEVPDLEATSVSNGEAQECYFIELNFPTVPTIGFNSADVSSIYKALNVSTIIDMKITTTSEDIFVVLPSAKSVVELQPQFEDIQNCPGKGIIVSGQAPSESGFDFYSRFFCPKFGINEDPVCGSAYCALAPYWSRKLGKNDSVAYAASPRSGVLNIHLDEQNQRVLLRGKAVTVMEGSLLV